MPYSAHDIIYTALSTLYLRALHPDCMFAIKQLYNNHFNNKDMDVPFAFESFLCPKRVGCFHSAEVYKYGGPEVPKLKKKKKKVPQKY